jgi:uncharacterized protein
VAVQDAGITLPAPIPLGAALPSPAGGFDQLERLEGMRVSAASLTVVAPTLGSVDEPNAVAASQGVFFAEITGVARAFREAGILAPDPPPAGSGSIPPIPRFDSNPEVLRIDSGNLNGTTAVDVSTGAVLTSLVGPLDYASRHYTILPETTATFAGGAIGGSPVAVPLFDELTIGSYNLQRFYDSADDPEIGEPVLTAAAFDVRLHKAALAIRAFLRAPDIVGIVEIENLATLQALAARISAEAIDAGTPDPLYQAFLSSGNDAGGIDVGFLVKQQIVAGATPRVSVLSVVQENLGEQLVHPNSSTEPLHDRPPLVLDAVVNFPGGGTYPLVVILNHLRSLNGVSSETAGSNGWATAGARVRAKRHRQALSLASLIQARQLADPAENIVVLGDFNAFEFNDGYGHSLGTLLGTPAPDNQTAVAGDGADLVEPDLTNLIGTAPPAQKYGYLEGGNAQNLDHVLVSSSLIGSTRARRLEHARINADYPETARNNVFSALRLSDHDPLVAFFQMVDGASADLSIDKFDSPDPVMPGDNVTYSIFVENIGPAAATSVTMTDELPGASTFVSLSSPAGWSCTTPAVGAGGTVSCSIASLAAGDFGNFSLMVRAPFGAFGLTNTATVTSPVHDPFPGNNSFTTTTVVIESIDVSITKITATSQVAPGADLSYTITLRSGGPGISSSLSFSDNLPAGTTFVSLVAPPGWSCNTPAVGASGTVSCSLSSVPPTSFEFTLVVEVDGNAAAGSSIVNTVTGSSPHPDPDLEDRTSTATVSVVAPSSLSATKTFSGSVEPGGTVHYQVVITNDGPFQQGDYAGDELVDVLPPGLILTGATSTSPTVLVNLGTNTVTWNGVIPAGGTVTIDIEATIDPAIAPGSTISNQGTLNWDADGDGDNDATGSTDDPGAGGGADPTEFVVGGGVPPVEVPVLDARGLLALALLIAAVAFFKLRR